MSAVSSAGFIVPYKAAINEGHGAALVFILILGAACFNTVASAGLQRGGVRLNRYGLFTALLMAVFTVLGNEASRLALAELHPAVTSALLQGQVLYVALVGYLVLRERVGLGYWLGAGCAVLGVFVLRAPVDSHIAVSVAGLVYGNIAAFCFGMLHVISRKAIAKIQPVSVNAVRLWFAVLALWAFPSVRDELPLVSGQQWALTFLAAFLGPFLARLSLMYSARYIPAAKAVLFALTTPVFALGLSFLVLGTLPGIAELLGSGLILVGIVIPLRHGRAGLTAR